MNDYRTGDRLLVAAPTVGSKALRWWLNSRYSHVVPIIDVSGKTLEVRYPQPYFSTVNDYLDGKHRILHLRPVQELSDLQINNYLTVVDHVQFRDYDILSFAGFLSNREYIENKSKLNCSEAMLTLDHAMGLLLGRSMALVSPQSYVEFEAAGIFKIVDLK